MAVMRNLDLNPRLITTEWREYQTVVDFAADLIAHGADLPDVRHVCMSMSAASAKRGAVAQPQAKISYEPFRAIAISDEVGETERCAEMRDEALRVPSAQGTDDGKTLKQLVRGMWRNLSGWLRSQLNALHRLQQSALNSAQARRLKMALREVYG